MLLNLPNCSNTIFSDFMAYLPILYQTEVPFLTHSFGKLLSKVSELRQTFLPPFTLNQMDKQKESTKFSNNTFEPIAITTKIIGLRSLISPNSLIIIPLTLLPNFRHSLPITDTIPTVP